MYETSVTSSYCQCVFYKFAENEDFTRKITIKESLKVDRDVNFVI